MNRAQSALAIVTALLLASLLYWPGLHSGFLLDDLSNLDGLRHINDEPSLHQFIAYVLSGFAGSLGRPLALVTFALQAGHWPNDPLPFKAVNIAVHLLNSVLLFAISVRLLRTANCRDERARLIAAVIAVLWLLHPLQVSTVLYVVQRMTELAATFSLGGIWLYLLGRETLERGEERRGYLLMSLGVGGGTILGTLAKENGALLPLFVLLIEHLVIRRPAPRIVLWRILFLYVPALALFGYLLLHLPNYLAGYAHRPFTLTDRLLTEPRILADYLAKLFSPRPGTLGLYHDDFPVTHTLTAAVPYILLHVALITGTFLLRRRFALVSLGILWFYAGHLLESTFIPLELYFEHRNYLPSVGIILAAVVLSERALSHLNPGTARLLGTASLLVVVASSSVILYGQTRLWGRPAYASLVWAHEHPNSPRAQSDAAFALLEKGRFVTAERLFSAIGQRFPHDPAPDVIRFYLHCIDPRAPSPPLSRLVQKARTGTFNLASVSVLNEIALQKENGKLKTLNGEDVRSIFNAFLDNPLYEPRYSALLQIYAMFEASKKNYLRAVNLAGQALRRKHDVRIGLYQLRWLVLAGQTESAYKYLPHVRELADKNLRQKLIWTDRINEWEQTLRRLTQEERKKSAR